MLKLNQISHQFNIIGLDNLTEFIKPQSPCVSSTINQEFYIFERSIFQNAESQWIVILNMDIGIVPD